MQDIGKEHRAWFVKDKSNDKEKGKDKENGKSRNRNKNKKIAHQRINRQVKRIKIILLIMIELRKITQKNNFRIIVRSMQKFIAI